MKLSNAPSPSAIATYFKCPLSAGHHPETVTKLLIVAPPQETARKVRHFAVPYARMEFC